MGMQHQNFVVAIGYDYKGELDDLIALEKHVMKQQNAARFGWIGVSQFFSLQGV